MSNISLAGRSPFLLLSLLLPALAHAQAPLVTLTSPNAEAGGLFGYAVSGVPDASGDNRGDLLVGAWAESVGAPGDGRVYLFSGATGTLLRTLAGPYSARGSFGYSVAGMQDADGDGRGDLLVGAPYETVGGVYAAGRAYLFSGATGLLLRTLTSPNPEFEGRFGWSVSGVPDASGDGRNDLLVGSYGEGGGVGIGGRAYLFSGATGTLLRTLIGPNTATDGGFGSSVSGVPDANGDDRGDLLVGAPGGDGGAIVPGRAYLFSGTTGALLHTLNSPNPEQYGNFGTSVSGVADVNGDGRGDLLIGADAELGQLGRAYLFSGGTGGLLRALTSPNPEGTNRFGYAASGVPDTDGDNRGDLLIGTFFESGGSVYAGRAYLFSGATGALRTLASPNPELSGHFGSSVAGVPDANGDGHGDLLTGTFAEDGGAEDAGRAYLFSGTGGLAVTASGNPPTISPGGTITVSATVSNHTPQPASIDLWVVATRSGNAVLTRLIGSGTLPAGVTAPVSFSLRVPSNTPPGTYSLAVNVGTFTNPVRAADAFNVTVVQGPNLSGTSIPAADPFVVEGPSGDVFAAHRLASSAAPSSPPSVVASPNPFAGRTTLRFTLAEAGPARLAVYDVLGREVARLLDGEAAAGSQTAVFEARGLASGVYVWRLATGGAVETGRLTLIE